MRADDARERDDRPRSDGTHYELNEWRGEVPCAEHACDGWMDDARDSLLDELRSQQRRDLHRGDAKRCSAYSERTDRFESRQHPVGRSVTRPRAANETDGEHTGGEEEERDGEYDEWSLGDVGVTGDAVAEKPRIFHCELERVPRRHRGERDGQKQGPPFEVTRGRRRHSCGSYHGRTSVPRRPWDDSRKTLKEP